MANKLNERIILSNKLKRYISGGDVIHIEGFKDNVGNKVNKTWKVLYVSLGKGNSDFICYEDMESTGTKLYRTFNNLSYILSNCDNYKLELE